MKRWALTILIPLAVATASIPPTGAALAAEGTNADVTAIQALWKTYSAARVAGDATLWLSLYDENGIQMPPGVPARGKDVLNEIIPKAFSSGSVTAMSINPEEITLAGDWAYSRGTYYTESPKEGETVRLDGKFLTILKREADGSWKIYRDCFNFNTP